MKGGIVRSQRGRDKRQARNPVIKEGLLRRLIGQLHLHLYSTTAAAQGFFYAQTAQPHHY
jgi:hypothetical protein